jgi:hypothetical protein
MATGMDVSRLKQDWHLVGEIHSTPYEYIDRSNVPEDLGRTVGFYEHKDAVGCHAQLYSGGYFSIQVGVHDTVSIYYFKM